MSTEELESVEHITLFSPSDAFDVESQRARESISQKVRLEPVIEEIEHVSETFGEEEMLTIEEEEQEEEELKTESGKCDDNE